MNYSTFVVRLVRQPKQNFLKDNISVVETYVKFVPTRQKKSIEVFKISVWGKLAEDLMKYYKINDYLIIEGYISLRKNNYSEPLDLVKDKEVEISILKFYPFINS